MPFSGWTFDSGKWLWINRRRFHVLHKVLLQKNCFSAKLISIGVRLTDTIWAELTLDSTSAPSITLRSTLTLTDYYLIITNNSILTSDSSSVPSINLRSTLASREREREKTERKREREDIYRAVHQRPGHNSFHFSREWTRSVSLLSNRDRSLSFRFESSANQQVSVSFFQHFLPHLDTTCRRFAWWVFVWGSFIVFLI